MLVFEPMLTPGQTAREYHSCVAKICSTEAGKNMERPQYAHDTAEVRLRRSANFELCCIQYAGELGEHYVCGDFARRRSEEAGLAQ